MVTSTLDGPAQLWDLTSLDSATEPIALRGQEGNLYQMAISPDGRWLATSSSDKVVRIWDLISLDPGADHIALRGHEGSVDELIFGTDSSWLVLSQLGFGNCLRKCLRLLPF